MAFILKLFAVLGVVTLSSAGPAKLNPRRLESEGITETQPDTYQLVPQLPLGFQLPKEEPAELPFYSPEPSVELSVPRYEPNEQNYYQAPIPSSDLTVPVVTAWNPNNDPKYYFEVPAALTKQDYPTNSYPKKFNKELHSKDKPFSSKPKQEIELQPIDGAQYAIKQKELYKTFQKLAKKENQKQSKAEEAQQTV